MNRLCLPVLVVSILAFTGTTNAGTIAGTGGATEITQIANNLQLVQQYEQMVAGYVRQGLQLQNELRNLTSNPASVLGPDIGRMINQMGSIMSGAQSIGWNMAQIDRNFATTFKSPQASYYAKSFTNWHSTSTGTIEAALKAIGRANDESTNSQARLSKLYDDTQSGRGNLDTMQSLAKVNVEMVQQLSALQSLLAAQGAAQMTYMQTQVAKEQKVLDMASTLVPPYTKDIPDVQTAPSPRWKGFGK